MPVKKQSGFAAVEILLVLILVSIVSFTGYYVWHSQKQTEKTLNVANNTVQTTTPKKSTTTDTQKYLTISEWGVKLPVSGDLSDAYYVYNADVGASYLSKASYKGTECAADKISLGAIDRFTGTDKDSETGATILSEKTDATQVGNYYYSYSHPQAGCFAGDDAASAAASNQMTEFKAATAGIVAAN